MTMRNRLRKLIAIVQLYGTVGLVYLIAEAFWRRPVSNGYLVAGFFAGFLLRERTINR
jgi:hypothetical protein